MNKFSKLTKKIVGMTSEGRNIYENEDGTRSSERLISWSDVGGKTYLYPSIFGGQDMYEKYPDTKKGRRQAMDEIVSIFKKNEGYDPETNIFYGTPYKDEPSATKAAGLRSRSHRKVTVDDIEKARKRDFEDLY